MSDEDKLLYLAGTGMITPLGMGTAMTAAAIQAGISAYASSGYYNTAGQAITMAQVPNLLFDEIKVELDEGDRFNVRHDRVTKMAILAINEACSAITSEETVPMVFASAESGGDNTELGSLTQNLQQNCRPWVDPRLIRYLHTGRAAGIDALSFAFSYLYDTGHKYVLVGGSDSHEDDERLQQYGSRLLAPGAADAFAPGEGAAFLLLTPHRELAQVKNGQVIGLREPGIAAEPGHLSSTEPYRGDGLATAFRLALEGQREAKVSSIYSSMNGELFWAKEYGVALLRNNEAISDTVTVKHPADCYGELGAATGTALVALAAEDLWANQQDVRYLVYASSDAEQRGAIVVEKMPGSPNDMELAL